MNPPLESWWNGGPNTECLNELDVDPTINILKGGPIPNILMWDPIVNAVKGYLHLQELVLGPSLEY